MTSSFFRLTRRHLLKGAALAGAALVCHAPAALLAAPASPLDAEAAPPLHTQTRLLMGTFVTLSVVHPHRTQAEEGLARTFDEISRLENILSRHNSATPLTQLNASGQLLDAPMEIIGVVDRALRVHSLTAGAFDITVAPLLDLFRAHSNPQGRLRLDAADLAAARELVSAASVHMAPDHIRLGRTGMALTLDGIAKGYIVDRASAMLTALGLSDHLVNAGGDIRASGHKAPGQPWRVAVEHPGPSRRGRVTATLNLTAAIATSGSYEIFYDASREHHHLIDPMAKASPQHMVSVSVTAPTAMEADALATALSVMDEGDALRLVRSLPGRECCLLAKNGSMLLSDGWGRA